MSETELTKRMKECTHWYKPLYRSSKRTIRYADEVWTPTGIVDSIRFEDYIEDSFDDCKRINYKPYINDDPLLQHYTENSLPLGQCKIKGNTFHCDACQGCFFRVHDVKAMGMCTTCFECKITLSDFKSKNGHNFHGNRNYYVVPKDLVKKIEHLVPDEIGILKYVKTENYSGLRMYKECKFKEISETLKWQLLYNAMKKWCDKAVIL